MRPCSARSTKHGPSGVVLTNVAKVQERRGAKREARATLRRALELDPNQDNGLLWWASDAREAGGEAEYVAALEAIAVLPGAWRPQLWLAREKLKAGDRAGALALYDQALARAGDASDALMMVTGDLGNAGALEDLVRLGAPRYKPEVHGPPAGMNIAQAFKQLGRIDEARDVVRRMQAMGWAPLAATLAALDADIMAAAPAKQDDGVPEVGAVAFDRPIWTRFLWEPDWLWREAAADEPVITLPTFANEMVTGRGNAEDGRPRSADARAAPLSGRGAAGPVPRPRARLAVGRQELRAGRGRPPAGSRDAGERGAAVDVAPDRRRGQPRRDGRRAAHLGDRQPRRARRRSGRRLADRTRAPSSPPSSAR